MSRMKKIVITSRSAGVGKTTLVRNLAVAASTADLSVICLDLCADQSLRRWRNRRGSLVGPEMLGRDPAPEALGETLQTIAASGYQICLIDTTSGEPVSQETAIATADLVVIPVRPTEDMRAVDATAETARRLGVPFLFVLTQAPRAAVTQQARLELEKMGEVAPVVLLSRTVHAEAEARGLGVSETRVAKAKVEIAALWDYLRHILGRQEVNRSDDGGEKDTVAGSRGTPSGAGSRKLSVIIDRSSYLRFKLHCAGAEISHQAALFRALTEFLDRAGAPRSED